MVNGSQNGQNVKTIGAHNQQSAKDNFIIVR